MLYRILLLFALFLQLTASAQTNLRIAISRCSGSEKYVRYAQWVKENAADAVIVDLFSMPIDSALKMLATCHGLVISGGPDIHPGRYGRAGDTAQCDMQLFRDTLEFMALKLADSLHMPVFGICRGMQLINVAYGGSLFVDIPKEVGKTVVHRTDTSAQHPVQVDSTSRLFKLTGKGSGMVNSYHHQGIDEVAKGFRVVSRSADQVPEAIEQINKKGKSYIFGIQWHPERLKPESPFSNAIIKDFLLEARKYKLIKSR